MKVALYARVSTRDGRQDTENQLIELREYANRQGWQIVVEYSDKVSGAAEVENSPEMLRMFRDAAARRFDRVLIWALDRFSRGTIVETFGRIQRLKASGVDIWSLTEEHFRTAGPAGDLFIAIAAFIAQYERIRLQERIYAGLNKARADGKILGRPRNPTTPAQVKELRDMGLPTVHIAQVTGLSVPGVYLRLRQANENAAKQ